MSHRLLPILLMALATPVAGSVGQVPSRAPLHRGEWLVSGSASLSRTTEDGFSSTTASLQPSGLVFVGPHLALGGTMELGYFRAVGGHSWNYGIGPSARFYLGNPAANWLPFVSAAFIPQWSSTHTTPSGQPVQSSSTSSYTADESLGLTRLLSTHVGITGEVSDTYAHATVKTVLGTDNLVHNNTIGTRFGFSVFVR